MTRHRTKTRSARWSATRSRRVSRGRRAAAPIRRGPAARRAHASHYQYALPPVATAPCIIEPGVQLQSLRLLQVVTATNR